MVRPVNGVGLVLLVELVAFLSGDLVLILVGFLVPLAIVEIFLTEAVKFTGNGDLVRVVNRTELLLPTDTDGVIKEPLTRVGLCVVETGFLLEKLLWFV